MKGVLARVARGAADVCHAEVAAVTMRAKNPDRLVLIDVFGTGGIVVEKVLPTAGSLNGMVVTRGRSFRSGDIWRERRPVVRAIAVRNRIHSLLIAPFATPEGLTGTLAVGRRVVHEFSARDQAALENFADMAGITIQSARDSWAPTVPAVAPPRRRDSPELRKARIWEPPPLTAREWDIVQLLLADRSCKEVASALGLSLHTVQHYVERLKLRCGRVTLHGLLGFLSATQSSPPPLRATERRSAEAKPRILGRQPDGDRR